MRYLERLVRDNVLPDTRPRREPPKIETEDDSDVEIIGARSTVINLTHSRSHQSSNKHIMQETFECYDVVRIFCPGDTSQFVDVEWRTFIRYRSKGQPGTVEMSYAAPQDISGVQQVRKRNQRRAITGRF